MVDDAQALIERVLAGHVASGARLIRLLEDGDAAGQAALRVLYPNTGRAQIVGITGPAGAGKSTLVDALVAGWRERGLRVGVVAVDPTSPFTGGALLGDRVRMQRHAIDPGVFIRSMATRGQRGGLARRTGDACLVLDAMGYERVLVETIGVGQDELEVTQLAHTTAVVCLPGTGDEVQALKAGLFEVGDLLVLNKADHPAADAARRDLEYLAHTRGPDRNGWEPRVLETVAVRGEGVPALLDAIEEHGRHLRETGAFARHAGQRARAALLGHLHDQIGARIFAGAERDAELRGAIEAVESGQLDPYAAADRLLEKLWAEEIS